MKVAFFDRDGTIIDDYPDEIWRTIEQPVFVRGSIRTLKSVLEKDYAIIITTNQYLINEGFITLDQYESITEQMVNRLAEDNISILDIFYCPHERKEGCSCIKPNGGMVRQALAKYPHINMDSSFVVGDSAVDVEMALNVNLTGYGIGLGKSCGHPAIYQLNDITELTEYI